MSIIDTLFIPANSGPTDPGRRALIEALVGEDMSTFSPREEEVYARASDHGECYWATIETDDKFIEAHSDLGGPASNIMLRVPKGVSTKKLLAALDAAAQVLISVD